MRVLQIARVVAGASLALTCAGEEVTPVPPPPPPPPSFPYDGYVAIEVPLEVVRNLATVDEAVGTVSSIAELATEYGGNPGNVLYSAVDEGDSVVGGIRGIGRRASSTPVPPLPPPRREVCEEALAKTEPMPCYCIYFVLDKLPLDTDVACQDTPPKYDPPLPHYPVTLRAGWNPECETYQVRLTVEFPASLEDRLPPEMKQFCPPVGDVLRCSWELTLVRQCPAGGKGCSFVGSGTGRGTPRAFSGRRFEFPPGAGVPEDFSSRKSVDSFLRSTFDEWKQIKDETSQCRFLKRLLKEDPGWMTEAWTWEDHINLVSSPLDKSAGFGPSVELRVEDVSSWLPDGKETTTRRYRIEQSTSERVECMPTDLSENPLKDAPAGRVVLKRYAVSDTGGDFTFGFRRTCLSPIPAPGTASLSPPIHYSSEEFRSTREFTVPPAASRSHPEVVSKESFGKRYMVDDPNQKYVWPDGKEPSDGAIYGIRGVSGRPTDGCPGEGEGMRTAVSRFASGGKRERVERWHKKHGDCPPLLLGRDGKPIAMEEDEEGRWRLRLVDDMSQELEVAVEYPYLDSRVLKFSSGFFVGMISLHAMDNEGFIGDGRIRMKNGRLEVDTAVQLSRAGWAKVRGKEGNPPGNTTVFWAERIERGAWVELRLIRADPNKVVVAPTPEGQAEPSDLVVTMEIGTASDPAQECELVGAGSLTLNPNTSSSSVFQVKLFEDESVLLINPDGLIANFPFGCAVGGDQAAGEERPIILSRPRPMSMRMR